MARRKKKKQPKFTISEKDLNEFKRLQNNAKAMIRSRKKKYGVDISGEIDLRKSITSFKTRASYNAWKEGMKKLKYRADLQITETQGVIASKKQVHQSKLEVNRMKKKLTPVVGKKDTFKNKYGVEFKPKDLLKLNLQTNVARDMEIKRQQYLESLPRFDKKGNRIRDTRKDKTEGQVIVRDKFDPTKLDTNVKVKIRQENLKQVSDPERYSRRDSQLRMNQYKAMRQAFGEDAKDVLDYFDKMSEQEFANFYFMYARSSMGFNFFYESSDSSRKEGSFDDRLAGALENVRTDIQRYDKNRDKYKLLSRY